MIEVFITNVKQVSQATLLVDKIHQLFVGCKANFDLHDCDNILRVCKENGIVPVVSIINLLEENGFEARVLPDTQPTEKKLHLAIN
ncbi:hypothetical protein BH11BAC3_BH11BAC3_43180 [soil metagenome]